MKIDYVNHMGDDNSVTNTELTITQQRILEAVERGYTVTESGKLIGIKGELSLKCSQKQRYPTFSSNWNKKVFGIPAHLFAAYIFYGKKAFEKGIVVRHLNTNTLDISKNNIVLGTHSENNLDKPKEQRIAAAKKARARQGNRPLNVKLSDTQVQQVKDYYAKLNGKKAPQGATSALAKLLNVSVGTLSKIKTGEYYANSVY